MAEVDGIGAAAPVPQFYGLEMFEHYQRDGYLLVATTDGAAIRLEPGDFIVKRMWSTAAAPYIYNAAPTPPTATPDQAGTSAEEGRERPGVPSTPPQAVQGGVSPSEGPSRANDTGAIRKGSA